MSNFNVYDELDLTMADLEKEQAVKAKFRDALEAVVSALEDGAANLAIEIANKALEGQ